MNKFIIPIFVIILSGCGSYQIENCADDKFSGFKSEPHFSYPACKKFLPGGKLTPEMIFDEINDNIKFSKEFYKCIRLEAKKDRAKFINQSLRKKLSNQLYEQYYLQCKSIYE